MNERSGNSDSFQYFNTKPKRARQSMEKKALAKHIQLIMYRIHTGTKQIPC